MTTGAVAQADMAHGAMVAADGIWEAPEAHVEEADSAEAVLVASAAAAVEAEALPEAGNLNNR